MFYISIFLQNFVYFIGYSSICFFKKESIIAFQQNAKSSIVSHDSISRYIRKNFSFVIYILLCYINIVAPLQKSNLIVDQFDIDNYLFWVNNIALNIQTK